MGLGFRVLVLKPLIKEVKLVNKIGKIITSMLVKLNCQIFKLYIELYE